MILVNGTPHGSIDPNDRGLHYGDGLFETVAIRHGRPQLWRFHMERLAAGCLRLGIQSPDPVLLAAEAEHLYGDNQSAVLKIIITRGVGGHGYRPPLHPSPNRILLLRPWPQEVLVQERVSVHLCHTPLSGDPLLAGIKHLNRLAQVMANSEWNDEAIAEGIMCDLDGNIIEGTKSNLFMLQEGHLLTPDLSCCGVAGVMRRAVLELAGELGIGHEITTIKALDLERMDAVFMTNAIWGIRHVARIGTTTYGKNPVTERLSEALHRFLEDK